MRLALIIIIILSLSACNNLQSNVNSAFKEIQHAEQYKNDMTSDDWTNLEMKMSELQKDLEVNRNDYTIEQQKEIGKLQGRYAALLVKKAIIDFKESVKDFDNQMEGFIEGITDSANNLNKQ